MDFNRIKKVAIKAKNGVKIIVKHPRIAQGVKIMGDAIKNHQDKKVAAQERIGEIYTEVSLLKKEIAMLRVFVYVMMGISIAALTAAIISFFI